MQLSRTGPRRRVFFERLGAGRRALPLPVLFLGLALGVASIIVYAASGYGWPMFSLWLAGALVLGAFFYSVSGAFPQIARTDLIASAGLALVFSPLYLAHLYDWPVQVTTDEPTIMNISRDYASKPDVDPFGVSYYQIRPALLFVVWGKLGNAIGGIDLFHMRLLHALAALVVIAASYALFVQLLPRRWALFASCLVGFSHSLLIISRLAMRENTAVLLEIVALVLLVWGLRHDHPFVTYCGGLVAGFGFYAYHPGRAVFVLWVLFLIALALLYRERFGLRRIAALGAIAVTGTLLLATPLLIAESKAPRPGIEVDPLAQLLITSKGRQLQKDWVYADSVWEGYKKNVIYGVRAFNSDATDNGYIYVNPGHGFVDPLTGILLWVGVGAVGFRLLRRRRAEEPWPLLMAGSFVVLWLAFAFLINEAPKYPRLLITLPFVAYLVTEAVRMLARVLARLVGRADPAGARRTGAALAAGALVAIGVGNLAIAWDYVNDGRKHGEPIGSTGRYIAAHPERNVYMAADKEGPYIYFTWGFKGWWKDWTRGFSGETELRDVIPSGKAATFDAPRPFGLLMNASLWEHASPELQQKYPEGRVREITHDGKLVVFEVPAST